MSHQRLIAILSRDCCTERLEGFGVSVGNTEWLSDSTHCAAFLSQPPDLGVYHPAFVDVPCPLTGRYVFVFMPRYEFFSALEVEVFSSSYSPIVQPSKKAETCARACLSQSGSNFKRGFAVKENSVSGACRKLVVDLNIVLGEVVIPDTIHT